LGGDAVYSTAHGYDAHYTTDPGDADGGNVDSATLNETGYVGSTYTGNFGNKSGRIKQDDR